MTEVTKIPMKYKLASKRKIKKVLSNLPPIKKEKVQLVVETSRGEIRFD